jgi:two-component system, NtrC family, nitrogen regulation sensor histidine kinase NtrY
MAFLKLTLRTRILLSMLTLILLSFLVTGAIAIYDHYEQKEKYNEQRLRRKEESVRASMNYFRDQMGDFVQPEVMNMVFSDKICELSDVHNLFIAVFDLQGKYLVSSSSFVMDSLQIPYQVEYEAMKGLTEKTRYVIDREINKEDYTLAYWYFYDAKGRPIAITNVVYDNADADPKDISAFLLELSQSYILLFILAVGVAYLLSRYITRSLQSVGTQMKGIELGGKMKPIPWEGNDEIGVLVKQYNDMLKELERSASLLAKTERESAWREMAQQVAHEIKNPLTPMKLRVQYLQKAWEENAPNFDDRLKAFSQSMTEQIDTLSRIASEFSNFAKLPKPDLKKLDIEEQCGHVIDFYKQQENCEILYRSYGSGNPVLMADKDQVIRMLNNLLNNALQAIPHGRLGKIELTLRKGQRSLIIRVQDNGVGISEEQRAKIFTPNFTTKSTGTGLGLAMIRNIMLQNKGHVGFTSMPEKGTSFFLIFPTQVP